VLGLGVAEGAFHLRDHGAFPHLNVYVADPRLGVRLRPFASQRLAAGRNPITSVRINRDGYRGADPSEPAPGEVVVVGDSQVFGLGVEEDQTASADLGRLLGRAVVNAGVPTYGPPEYNAVVDELLARRQVGTVIYVVNLANDLFEAARPNVDRHTVWDGWAVRKETAPPTITSFPGRELLFQRSHLVHALRSYLYARGPVADERGFPSEGTAADLVGVAARADEDHARAARETEQKRAERDGAIKDTAARELAAEIKLEDLALDAFQLRGYELGIAYARSRENPGDIVVQAWHTPEESRDAVTTANYLFNGAQVRKQIEDRIRVFAEQAAAFERAGAVPPDPADTWEYSNLSPAYAARHAAREGRARPLVLTLEERDALKKRLDELRDAPVEIVRAWSPMTPLLRQVKAACDARGARLLVVALPMDLMVSPAEWAKYGGATPRDMAPTRILIDDLLASAAALGAMTLDATPALAAAEPGAFLDGDIHMTPKGHAALAEALAAKLRAP
jgi:plasmid stabilization system protein ParE